MRFVLDTNILVSAFISRKGPPGQVLDLVRREGHLLITSAYQLDELRSVLSRDRLQPYIRPDEARDFLDTIESIGLLVEELPEVEFSPDPKDNPILATAIAGAADLIVSGDKVDMLALGGVEGIPIVKARDAVGLLEG